MQPFQERRKVRKILYSKTVLVVLFVIFLLVARGAWNVYQKAIIAETERDRGLENLKNLQERTRDLEASIARLKSGVGEEEELRQKFSVAQSGEDVVVVVDETAQNDNNSGASQELSFWDRVASFFKGSGN